MLRSLYLSLALACGPTSARIEVTEPESSDTDAPITGGCAETPPDLADLPEVAVTSFYAGALKHQPESPPATFIESTPIQREWSTVWPRWAPDGADFGNLDADPRNAGHGVLLGAYRTSTCGLTVEGVRAWQLDDGSGTTYVEARLRDSSGGCESVCDAEGLAGAAVGVPIVDFPFSGPIVGCVIVQDGCE